ncbi:MAG: bifunctional [glutamate--ammonia ligase]-adenylyl-L-tyrosine phosphorylase/[glutamate--ammonia-ligase] adenylyltransferase, partial [Desulfobacteraceae bacterium]|nr:bifunctional [glutamate--ammonia ligase]-adenylyl-L-tyrosine phosphorylase/[glutamate--ammonia-ligase] adenylyltransferase [Desulfobacteraceae bacterium]
MTDAPTEFQNRHQQEQWHMFCQEAMATGMPFSPATAGSIALATAFDFSEFVSTSCIRHPHMALDLIDGGDLLNPYANGDMAGRLAPLLLPVAKAATDIPMDGLLAMLKSTLRQFRRREMVRIAVRDLAGVCDLDDTMADLSALAAAAIDGALGLLFDRMCATDGVPEDDAGNGQRLVVIGMGKLGAGELNFSSDVDLIFTFPASGETRGGRQALSNEAFFTRLCRYLIQAIGENTADGLVFRVDTRLRPYGDGGPLVMNFDHMEDYYQFQGREWERYALIKADVVAGDRNAGQKLLRRLRPFVYRRYLDFGVFESLREMKQKITAEVRRKKLHDNIKLGSGGIREIEFFGQMFQLIRGGVLPALQQPAIQAVLDTLGKEGFVPQPVCRDLTEAYRFLRKTEHRLQETSDQQTHALPSDPLACLQLARSMGFDTWADYLQVLDGHRERVRSHFDGLLEPVAQATSERDASQAATDMADAWSFSMTTAERRRILETAGFQDSDAAATL